MRTPALAPTAHPLQPAAPQGAPLGNKNAAKPDRMQGMLVVRCHDGEKGRWVRAANRAKKLGQLPIPAGCRSVLAAWVCHTLAAAAKAELGAAK